VDEERVEGGNLFRTRRLIMVTSKQVEMRQLIRKISDYFSNVETG
jgi:hypothetical protein